MGVGVQGLSLSLQMSVSVGVQGLSLILRDKWECGECGLLQDLGETPSSVDELGGNGAGVKCMDVGYLGGKILKLCGPQGGIKGFWHEPFMGIKYQRDQVGS